MENSIRLSTRYIAGVAAIFMLIQSLMPCKGQAQTLIPVTAEDATHSFIFPGLNFSDKRNYIVSAIFTDSVTGGIHLQPGLIDPPIIIRPTPLALIVPDSGAIISPPIDINTGISINVTTDNAIVSVRYFDAFGKPEQEVLVGAGVNASDVVSHFGYDSRHRLCNRWSAGRGTGNGAYTPVEEMMAGYQELYADAPENCRETLSYLAEPMSRQSETRKAGTAWQEATGMTAAYFANAATGNLACRRFNGMRNASQWSVTAAGVYSPGSLKVVKSVDEDGHESYNFFDCNDSLIMHRMIIDSRQADTHYIRDQFHEVMAVVSPEGSDIIASYPAGKTMTVTDPALDKYAFMYRIDMKARINGRKTPGADWIEYIYDRVGNPVMWQDGNLRQAGSFMACAFDRLGRQVYSAIVPDSRSITTIRGEWMTRYAPAEFSGASGSLYGYSPVFSGIGADDLLTVNYYDGYSFLDFMSGDSLAYRPRSGYGTMPAATGGNLPAKGRLTGTLTRVLGADADEAMLLTAMYYDGRGRVVQSHATNHRGGRDSWYHSLSFDGRPLRMLHIHATADTTVTDEYRYTYDASCRPVATYLSHNGAQEQRLEQLTYGHTGLVASRELLKSQSPVTYTYDVHGWLTGIAGGEFAQTLRYDQRADGSAGYLNGNIASSTVTNGRLMYGATADTYEYRYDHADRLIGADFSSRVTMSSSVMPDPYCRDTDIPGITAYSYDRNGNITSLTRRGPTGTAPGLFPGSVNTVYGAVDSLVIALDGNRLLKVDDLADDSYSEPSMDFFDGDDQPVEYTYDANGNLTSDLNKGITSITYNAVDRPETVTFDDGHQIRFTWDAMGRKLAASYLVDRRTTLSPVAGIESDSLGSLGAADMSTMLTRHYCGEHIYADNRLERTITPVGYIDGASGNHYAYIRDHQGNNRATLSDDGWHTEVMKYYPFGAATWHGDQTDRYRFGGKELDRTLGLDLYDFEARMYDPVLARFCQPDPMAGKYPSLSPYAYCANNPIRYIDPSGQIIMAYGADRELYTYSRFKDGTYGFINNSTGIPFNGDNINLDLIGDNLRDLQATPTGNWLVKQAINADETAIISMDKGDNSYDSSDFTINWFPSNKGGIHDDNNITTRESLPFISLGHELTHFVDHTMGTLDSRIWLVAPKFSTLACYSEISACYIENLLRMENNLPLRTHYIIVNNQGYEPSRVAKGHFLLAPLPTLIAPPSGISLTYDFYR